MRLKLAKTMAAGLAAATALGGAQPALAAPAAAVSVPCRPAALAAAIGGAASNQTLQLAAACTYVLTSALPAITQNLTIEGNRATLVRSTAAGTPSFAILTATAGNLAVSQLSFRNGAGGAISYQSGSAAGGSIAVTGGTFTRNFGGAINDDGSPAGPLTVTGAIFTRNTGGAINDGDPDSGSGALTVGSTTFTGNAGGGITDFGNSGPGNDTITSSTFTGNAGGGVNYQSFVVGVGKSTLVVAKSDFTDNTGSGINCAAFEICSLSVIRSTFTGNAGSAIFSGSSQAEEDMTVSGSTFTRNRGVLGGAVDLDSFGSGILTATDDTFTGNTATVGGGAIYNFDYLAATNSTFTGNAAPVGGGVENEWNADVTGSTFRNNSARSGGGGLYNDDYISLTGTNFGKNAARWGGGIYQIPNGPDNFGQGTPTLSLINSRVSGNAAILDGGGIDNTIDIGYTGPGPGPGTVTVTGSQVLANSAGRNGGGIFNLGGGSVPLLNSALRGNRPNNCAPANAIPDCVSAAALAGEPGAGQGVGTAPRVECMVDRRGRPVLLRNLQPRQCGVHDLPAGQHPLPSGGSGTRRRGREAEPAA